MIVVLPVAMQAQIAPIGQIPGVPTGIQSAQAAQAFGIVQAQSMTMTNQGQLQAAIFSQASMMSNPMARAMFMGQAAGLQVRTMTQSSTFNSQMASMYSLQASLMVQRQFQAQSAILRMRGLGVINAAAVQKAVLVAQNDAGKFAKQNAMLHAVAAQAAGQAGAPQSAAPVDVPTLPAEAPPMMIRPTFGAALGVEKPEFSQESGLVPSGTKIKLKSETHYTTLYYTTNGWTPTTQSAKYTGPITVDTTMHLQVMGMGPNYQRSPVERADYEVPNKKAPEPEQAVVVAADGKLRAGTPIRVAFSGKEIDSKSAAVGDEITIVLDEDIKVGDKVIAAKGSPVNAALTIADPGKGAAPGDLVFELHSVDVGGKRVALFGGETLEGVKGGKNAVIKPGMTALAFVSVDANLN